eukprot:scaffold12149_cov118-Isochrysis_galbana.AAC.1
MEAAAVRKWMSCRPSAIMTTNGSRNWLACGAQTKRQGWPSGGTLYVLRDPISRKKISSASTEQTGRPPPGLAASARPAAAGRPQTRCPATAASHARTGPDPPPPWATAAAGPAPRRRARRTTRCHA